MAETLKIKDLPPDARPREAFMRSAEPERDIPDASLLAILIRTGHWRTGAALAGGRNKLRPSRADGRNLLRPYGEPPSWRLDKNDANTNSQLAIGNIGNTSTLATLKCAWTISC